MKVLLLGVLLVACVALCSGAESGEPLGRALRKPVARMLKDEAAALKGVTPGPLRRVRAAPSGDTAAADADAQPTSSAADAPHDDYEAELAEEGLPDDRNIAWGRCEVCTLVLARKEYGQRGGICKGLAGQYLITCGAVIESLLMMRKWLPWWTQHGCTRMTQTGIEVANPCPEHVICSWIPATFGKPFCPNDPQYRYW